MEHAVSAAEANRKFSHILREVRAGASYTVMNHGRPVARIVPYSTDDSARKDARAALMRRLDGQCVVDIGTWQRDELYSR